MWIILSAPFIEIILNIIIAFCIPKKRFFKTNYLYEFLYSDLERAEKIIDELMKSFSTDIYYSEDDIITNLFEKLIEKLDKLSPKNKAILGITITIIIILALETIIFIYFSSNKSFISDFLCYYCLGNSIKYILIICNWVISLVLINGIIKIKTNEDKFGFTNEIKKGIIIIIILLSVNIIYNIIVVIVIFYRIDYINNQDIHVKDLEKRIKELEEENKILKGGGYNKISEKKTINNIKINTVGEVKNDEKSERTSIKDKINNNDNDDEESNEFSENSTKEKLMSIVFYSDDKKINCSMIVKNTYKYSIAEQFLYEKYPEYKEEENIYFLCSGKEINRNKTFQENNIKNSDIISISKIEA